MFDWAGVWGLAPISEGGSAAVKKEAAAARDGRGSPSHQHTAPGRQLYFLFLSAGGANRSRRSRLEDVAGGAAPRLY